MIAPATTARPRPERAGKPLMAAARQVVPVAGSAADITYLPGEGVLLLRASLPPAMSAVQRRAAIGFAIEDHLGQPLDQVNVVLGPQMSDGHWLVAVVDRDVLAGTSVPAGHRLLPDTLIVPVPDEGWAVQGRAGRVLVRLADGTGFAADAAYVVRLWQLAGSPPVLSYGGPLPDGLTLADTATMPDTPDPSLARFDLLAGTSTGQGLSLPRGIVLALALLGAFLLGHLVIAATDMIALSRLEAARETQLRAVLAERGMPAGDDLTASLSRALADQPASQGGGFLDLSSRLFAPIADLSGQLSLADMRYNAASGTIVMTLEAANLEALQQIENRLLDAGLTVQSGAATTRDGAAEVQMTVGGGAP